MPTAPCTIHLPGREPIPATLSTDRPESSYNIPVLVVEGGKSFEGREVAHGVGDVTSYGLAAALLLDVEPGDAEPVLERWQRECVGYLQRQGLTMADEWLYAGGWEDGIVWAQQTEGGVTRRLVVELDRAPLDREVVRHVADNQDVENMEGPSWTFPDGSGVVEVGDVWDVFGTDGRTEYGRIIRADE